MKAWLNTTAHHTIRPHFLQTDPIGSGDDLDLYAYTHDDPIDGSDPTGQTDETWYEKAVRLGKAAEKIVDAKLKEMTGQEPVKNVTFKDPKTGSTSRVDQTVKTKDGNLTVRETKANTSPVKTNQNNVLKSIDRGDAVPRGQNAVKAGLEPGKPVGEQVQSADVKVSRIQFDSNGQAYRIVESPTEGTVYEPIGEPIGIFPEE
jgi:hypothetical protein